MDHLPELQQRMLAAIRSEGAGVEVSRVGEDMVLVRVGEHRWYGKQAVNAVMTLMVRGFLTRIGSRFELTETGARLARTLAGPQPTPKPAAARAAVCMRCRKPLQPRQLRCPACGARVSAAQLPGRPAPGPERSID